MKLLTLAGLALAAASLCACSSIPGMSGGNASAWSDAAVKIASDPACGHTDQLDVMLGPVPSGHIHLERTCVAQTGAAAAAPPPPPAK